MPARKMTSATTRRPGRPARLSREQVLRTALAIADREGVEGLTLRAISKRVRAEPMSLYRHVRNKEDILDGIVDLVFAEIELPPPGPDWKGALRSRAISARDALRRHPWAIALMESRKQPGPANLQRHEGLLAILKGAGFTSLTATRAANLIDSYVYGFVLQEVTLPVATPEDLSRLASEMFQQIPTDAYPHLRQAAFDLAASGFRYSDEFPIGLDLILDRLEEIREADVSARG